jgi:hypothetical protein
MSAQAAAMTASVGRLEQLADGVHALHDPGFMFLGLCRVGSRMEACFSIRRCRTTSPVRRRREPVSPPVRGRCRDGLAGRGDRGARGPPEEAQGSRHRRRCRVVARRVEGHRRRLPIAGSMLGETVLLHRPTGTLVSADLVENFSSMEHAITRASLSSAARDC